MGFNMDFASALILLNNGLKVRRKKWNEDALNHAWLEKNKKDNSIDFKANIKMIGLENTEILKVLKHYANTDTIFSYDDVTACDWEEYIK